MHFKKLLSLAFYLVLQPLCALPLREQFEQTGYAEIYGQKQERAAFDTLYASFDAFIELLQTKPHWLHKITIAKERFIRSRSSNLYSTDYFGFYDESKRRGQISFYYSTHFHEFISTYFPELLKAPEVIRFFDACFEIQKPYGNVFAKSAAELGIETIFNGPPPLLFKVVKYLPSYSAEKPHYDGVAFSLFLDSTDDPSLLLSPYKSSFSVEDFSAPMHNSILLIPGTFLREFSFYPTPHIVLQSGKVRYAAIAFAMRSNYFPQKPELAPLPSFCN